MMDKHDRDWALTVGLLAIHQAEEVLVSCEDWLDRVGTSGSPWLDRHLRRTWMASPRMERRIAAQVAQAAAIGVLHQATRRSARATRAATTVLVLGWSAAFAMHVSASVRTRTVMPGTSTSILPGWIGSALVLREVWSDE